MPKFAVILAAAGQSSRFTSGRRKKPFVELKGRPLWVRCADVFSSVDDVTSIAITIADEDIDWFRDTFRANLGFMNVEVVSGGAERADSVQNALAQIPDDTDYVAVHDAARPLITKQWVRAVFDEAVAHGAAIPAVPIAGTVKKVDETNAIEETVPRAGLWEAQTPQVFQADLLRRAYAKRGGFQATDEAQLVERIGHPVRVVNSSPMNFKITTSDDFKMAEALINRLPTEAGGLGSLHPFSDGPGRLFD
ncbi:2-C-methyl-D-erythritol 4-phosphate cytidylyltransferase [Stratiformator vulcanicus]|uniref:2-C-methyl-D-erythritol 4-phosphate cytidylyltransferase n=1 Tax=Stratiformator vulcanicus TaxID=2527980 RepID=A0A517R319_9PLAN|nr:2-C-methyl-D-erythritol 4-phosphate cytidylyltransferase [Stratiformator vulcanicus]QDT38275.1 2-C-methyl-D-erythritol 4-phosphate cytidylyltransferase [Stratiformator vulcanicus]